MDPRKAKVVTLSRNERVVYPTHIIYFDTETQFNPSLSEQQHKFRLCVACHQRYEEGVPVGETDWEEFFDPSSFWDWVESKAKSHRSLWIIAHNMDFDFGAVNGFSELSKRGWDLAFFAFSWAAWIARFTKGRAALKFIDSVALFKEGVEALGYKIGLRKLKMPTQNASRSAWITYCTRDVEVIKEALEWFIRHLKRNDLGSLGVTASSQALITYRHKFIGQPITVHHWRSLQQVERNAYYGGRTEAFYIGKVPASKLYYLDVKGMYASILRDEPVPVRFLTTVDRPSFQFVNQCLKKLGIIAQCTVNLSEACIPFRGDKVLFPVGRFSTVLPGPEFSYCWERGYVEEIERIYLYQMGRPFESYAEYFATERQEATITGDEIWDRMCKLYLNSLYGKFGQTNPVYEKENAPFGETFGAEIIISSATRRLEVQIVWNGKVWRKVGEEPAWWTFYPIPAWITAYARLRLWEYIKLAGHDHTFYCDTDSIFVDEIGYRNVKHLVKIGQIGKLELRDTSEEMVIHGCKDYEFAGRRVMKGVPDKAIEISPGVYRYVSFERLKTRLNRGRPDGVYQVEKSRSRVSDYDKGTVESDGWVTPLVLPAVQPQDALLPQP